MIRIRILLLPLLSGFAAVTAFAAGSGLKPDERVLFFPGIAAEQADGTFTIPIEAWVFEEESSRFSAFALSSWMGIDLDACTPAQKERFKERTRYSRADSECGKTLTVRLNSQTTFNLPDTNPSGRTSGQWNAEREAFRWQEAPEGFGIIEWALEAPGHPSRPRSCIRLCRPFWMRKAFRRASRICANQPRGAPCMPIRKTRSRTRKISSPAS